MWKGDPCGPPGSSTGRQRKLSHALQIPVRTAENSGFPQCGSKHQEKRIASPKALSEHAHVRSVERQLPGSRLAAIDSHALAAAIAEPMFQALEIGLGEQVRRTEAVFGFDGQKSIHPKRSRILVRLCAAKEYAANLKPPPGNLLEGKRTFQSKTRKDIRTKMQREGPGGTRRGTRRRPDCRKCRVQHTK